MTIRAFEQNTPQVAESTFVDETALVIGDAILGKESSIWPMVVVRGDVNAIRIGERSNIQDGTVIHVTHRSTHNPDGYATHISHDVTVGHRCILHGCTIEDHCLIGMNSCLMDNVHVEPNVIVGAGSLVTPGKTLTSGYLWLGSPVKRIRPLTSEEIESLTYSANHYVKLARLTAGTEKISKKG